MVSKKKPDDLSIGYFIVLIAKYYLSDEFADRFKQSIKKDKYPFGREYKVIGTTVENEEEKGTNSRGWVYDINGCISTLAATDYKQPKQIPSMDRIRKLTPREYLRLMGMRDDDIDKIQTAGISNTQQYKMAGNSIVVNVLEAIFKELFL